MKKVKPLFPLKHCHLHPSSKIHKAKCSCGEIYIGDTIRNVEKLRQNEILLKMYQKQPKILLIAKNTASWGAFYLLFQKMVEHVKI